MLDLTKSRAALIAENKVYRAQLNGSGNASRLTIEQRERLQSNQFELDARVAVASLEVDQLIHLQQAEIKLA